MAATVNSAKALRVLEVGASLGPAAVAGRLLADLGAAVNRLPTGNTSRLNDAGPALSALQAGKTVLAPEVVWKSTHDVVLTDRVEDLAMIHANIDAKTLVCAITPYGLNSPWRDRPASEIALQAATGLAHITGFPGDPPAVIPAPLVTHIAGMMAATAVLSALRLPAESRPRVLDVSGFNAMFMNFGTRMAHFLDTGTDEGRQGNRYWMAAPFSLYVASDGHVMICVFSDRQWQDLLAVMGQSALDGDPRFRDNRARCANWQVVDKLVEDWTAARTVDDVVARLNEAGIPAGPVFSPEQVLADPILSQRGITNVSAGRVSFNSPVRGAGLDQQVLATWHTEGRRVGMKDSPLAGLRVLEVGVLTAAPFAGRLLRDLGAEVIKIEVPGRGDPARAVGADVDAAGGTYFHCVAAGKRSIALDLRQSAQLAQALDIAAGVDIVIENLGAGVLDTWGFGAEVMRRRNPSLIFCSISGYGRRGPGVQLRAYDGLIQARSGLMQLIRAPDRPPTKVGISIADQMGPLFAAVSIAAAVLLRDQTGKGCDLDVAMYDALTWILADALLEQSTPNAVGSLIGEVVPRDGHYVVLPPRRERYWPTTPDSGQTKSEQPCLELPEVVNSAQAHDAELVRISQHGGATIRQIGSSTGLPPPFAQLRGFAPRLNELAFDADALRRIVSRSMT